MNLTLAILAGGLATRMQPFTKSIPKSLLRIQGEFFISHQLRYLSQQGFSKVVLCVGHLGEQIKILVGNGSDFGLEVQYSWDGPQLLGTGGALRQALPLLGEAFFILYGDSYLPINYAVVEKNFLESNQLALMTVFKNKNRWDKSNAQVAQNLVLEYNKKQPTAKMEYIDYGLSILSASLLYNYPLKESFDLAEVFYELSLQKKLLAYEVFEPFYEIGSMVGFNEMNQFFNLKRI